MSAALLWLIAAWALGAVVGLHASPTLAWAQETSVTAYLQSEDGNAHFQAPFDDGWFAADPTAYDHQLAKGSLGLAVSAFRDLSEPLGNQQTHAVQFLREAGFSGIQCGGYDQLPASDTVASVVAYKQMDGYLLVAAVICGGRYQSEWAGNVTICDPAVDWSARTSGEAYADAGATAGTGATAAGAGVAGESATSAGAGVAGENATSAGAGAAGTNGTNAAGASATPLRHYGFDYAAQIVDQRILDLLEYAGTTQEGGIDTSQPLVLWVTGYSRGGAVANLVAADMTDCGRFERVYGYCFAPPATVQVRQPGQAVQAGQADQTDQVGQPTQTSYPNIFNICGKFDGVPGFPLTDWGYGHFGTTLYLPAQETDTGYAQLLAQANSTISQITGAPLRCSASRNANIRLIMEYFLLAYPTAADYAAELQPTAAALFDSPDFNSALANLVATVVTTSSADPTRQAGINGLSECVIDAVFDLLTNEDSTVAKLFYEHFCEAYVGFIFASDGSDLERLYAPNRSYARLCISVSDVEASCVVDVYDLGAAAGTAETDSAVDADQTGRFVQRMDESGQLSSGAPLAMTRQGGQIILVVPADHVYQVTITCPQGATRGQTVTCTATHYEPDSILGQTAQADIQLEASAQTSLVIPTDGLPAALGPAFEEYSPDIQQQAESKGLFNLSVPLLLRTITMVAAGLGLCLAITVGLAIRRRVKGIGRDPAAAVLTHGVVALMFMFLQETCRIVLPGAPILGVCFGALASLSIVMLLLKLLTPNQRRLGLLIAGGLGAHVVGDVFFLSGAGAGLFAYTTSYLLFTLAFVLESETDAKDESAQPMQKISGQLAQWGKIALVSAAGALVANWFSPGCFPLALLVIASVIAMADSARRLNPSTRALAVVLLAPDCLRMLSYLISPSPYLDLAASWIYYLSLLAIAAGLWMDVKSQNLPGPATPGPATPDPAGCDPADCPTNPESPAGLESSAGSAS
ncbi:MAG: lysoplasmalogenase family protein [Eggerthellales bacterium]|nr:lysoplasmalogenase family protein [Eggerthellales bacterium]